MRKARLTLQPGAVVAGGLDRRTGYAAAQQLLSLEPRCTAIVVDNSIVGIGLIRALLDAKVRIGRDMSVIVDGGVPADTLFADLTVAAVLQPTPYGSGQALGEMASALVERRALAELHVLHQPQFAEGNSIAPPAA